MSIIHRYRFKQFQKKWRKINAHNLLIPTHLFPENLVTSGKGSYGPLTLNYWGSPGEGLTIGNYCSIASGVVFVLGGNHNYHFPSTYPFRSLAFGQHLVEGISRGPIILGDDVWIGRDALILSGVSISTGAVVGARAVIAKDIPAYAVVVGNPAKIVGYRFSKSIIEKLLKINWGELDPKKLSQAHLLHKEISESNVDALLASIR